MKHLVKIRITPGAFLLFAVLLYAVSPHKIAVALCGIAIHETGHIIAILAFGGGIASLTVRCGGLEIRRKREDTLLCDGKKLLIALGGIFANLIGWAVLINAVPDIAWGCLFFAFLNALPIPSLDGGAAMSIVLTRFFSREASDTVGKAIGYIFLFILWLFSVYLLLYYPDNPTPFVMCVCIFLCESRG